MEKRAVLGVQRKRPTKRGKKKLLEKLLDYLSSDSYMFAPLISPRSKAFRPSATKGGVEPIKETNDTRLREKIVEYLKSDSYLYAALVAASRSSSPPLGPSRDVTRVRMAVSTRKVTVIGNETRNPSSDEVAVDEIGKSLRYEKRISSEQNFERRETVKHLVYQNCRSTSVSEKEMLNSLPRKLID